MGRKKLFTGSRSTWPNILSTSSSRYRSQKPTPAHIAAMKKKKHLTTLSRITVLGTCVHKNCYNMVDVDIFSGILEDKSRLDPFKEFWRNVKPEKSGTVLYQIKPFFIIIIIFFIFQVNAGSYQLQDVNLFNFSGKNIIFSLEHTGRRACRGWVYLDLSSDLNRKKNVYIFIYFNIVSDYIFILTKYYFNLVFLCFHFSNTR